MSLNLVVGILLASVVWLAGCFFTRKTNSHNWPLWLGLIVSVTCILMLSAFGMFHKTQSIRKEVTEETLWMTSTGNEDHCLVMKGDEFQFAYVDEDGLHIGKAEIKDSSVFYNPKDNKVIVKTVKITERQTFLFLYDEGEKTEVKYEFHIPGRETILFDFENRKE